MVNIKAYDVTCEYKNSVIPDFPFAITNEMLREKFQQTGGKIFIC